MTLNKVNQILYLLSLDRLLTVDSITDNCILIFFSH